MNAAETEIGVSVNHNFRLAAAASRVRFPRPGGGCATVRARWLARRGAFVVVAVWVVLSATFLLVAATPDPNEARIEWQAAGDEQTNVTEALQRYREARNRDEPLVDRYATWMGRAATFDWGVSFSRGRQVTALLADTLPRTAAYVLPAFVLATLGGLGLGVYRVLVPESVLARGATLTTYAAGGIPNFWLAELLLFYVGTEYVPGLQRLGQFERTVLWPSLVLATALLVSQTRFTRSQVAEYTDTDFVKLLRAKGASRLRVARHLLKNAALPLVAVAFTDLFGVLVLSAFVIERVFGVGGVASLLLVGVEQRDTPLVVGATLAIAYVAIAATVLQDVAHRALDPRVGD